ncbi:hypothetical protein KGM_205509 [Danaus plexippus plexippus]|uniref:Uncharacterized protein n=1 Tax=Danaus plexippus plexippus TaxID=278856 RepID=A0A212EMU0_DANPL|nr:hypothetical protein KGM_205509 [Danaus plexippus plexippus]
MESSQILKETGDTTRSASTSSSNQLFMSESLDLPDDTFRMSLDYISVIGENVTICDRKTSVDSDANNLVIDTLTPCNTPIETNKDLTQSEPPLQETPKRNDDVKTNKSLLKLSLTKNIDDGFLKPSSVADIMSPAKMLQFEVDFAKSSTPTMKRAAIDFNFFGENNFEDSDDETNAGFEEKDPKMYKETPVIVKANTVRHQIEYEVSQGATNYVYKIVISIASHLYYEIGCSYLEYLCLFRSILVSCSVPKSRMG